MDHENLLNLFMQLGNLKKEKRSGWIRSGVKNPESVADHSFRMAIMAFFLTPHNLDKNKTIKLCLIHDIAESEVGDIITWREYDMTKKEKQKFEQEAMKKISSLSNNRDLINLWKEYENQKTKEANFVKQIDILEMVLQAYEYKKDKNENQLNKYIETFFETGKEKITNPKLKQLLDKILKIKK